MKCFMDLHSSMDRFKGNGVKSFNHSISIYIPVWIDLKPEFFRVMKISLRYLHSSMDRFEVTLSDVLAPTVNDLHSSMDRFEGLTLKLH